MSSTSNRAPVTNSLQVSKTKHLLMLICHLDCLLHNGNNAHAVQQFVSFNFQPNCIWPANKQHRKVECSEKEPLVVITGYVVYIISTKIRMSFKPPGNWMTTTNTVMYVSVVVVWPVAKQCLTCLLLREQSKTLPQNPFQEGNRSNQLNTGKTSMFLFSKK